MLSHDAQLLNYIIFNKYSHFLVLLPEPKGWMAIFGRKPNVVSKAKIINEGIYMYFHPYTFKI